MENLVHYIYCSAATHAMSTAELSELLETAKNWNRSIHVTGILLYIDGTFFQVLEGEEKVVKALYDKICRDPRHTNVTTIICESIAKRNFPEWTMAYSFVSDDDLDSILDAHGVRGNRHAVSRLKEGRSRRLLSAFAEGRWRNRLVTTLPPNLPQGATA